MANYTVQDTTTGKKITFEWNGAKPPTDSDMEEVFKATKPQEAKEPKSVGGFIGNVGSDVVDIAKGAYTAVTSPIETAKNIGNLGLGASEAVQRDMGIIDYEPRQREAVARQAGKGIVEAVKHPIDTAYEKPVSTAMNLSGALGVLGKGAEVANMSSLASKLSTASKAVNPVSLAGKAVEGITSKIAESNIPNRLYGSAIKTPLSKSWTEVLPNKDMSKRTAAIEAGIENKINPSEFGLAKIKQLERQTKQMVDDIVDSGSVSGDVVNTQEIITNGLKKAYDRAANSSDPVGAKALVDEIGAKFAEHGDTIPTKKLNEIKRQLYDEVKWGGSEQTALTGQLMTMGKKGMAHEAMVALEGYYPEIKALNKADASYIALKEAIEKAIGREANKDILGLGAKVLSVRSIPVAIVEATISHPQVKARLSFALNKTRGVGMQNQNISNVGFQVAQGANIASPFRIETFNQQVK